jgi:hypothetical protein
MILSITRLRTNSLWNAIQVFFWSAKMLFKLRTDQNYLAGKTGFSPPYVFWTMSLWTDLESMKKFVVGPDHLQAMKVLPKICSEAVTQHRDWDQNFLPPFKDVRPWLEQSGKFIPVKQPTEPQKNRVIPELGIVTIPDKQPPSPRD